MDHNSARTCIVYGSDCFDPDKNRYLLNHLGSLLIQSNLVRPESPVTVVSYNGLARSNQCSSNLQPLAWPRVDYLIDGRDVSADLGQHCYGSRAYFLSYQASQEVGHERHIPAGVGTHVDPLLWYEIPSIASQIVKHPGGTLYPCRCIVVERDTLHCVSDSDKSRRASVPMSTYWNDYHIKST